jgi:catechol 2,3-dioxygenase-like lactoylglutathione lyase family enzyme
MGIHFGFIGIVTSDLAASLAFYRTLGISIPDGLDDAPHVDATIGELTIAWDTVGTIRTFDPEWTKPTGSHRVALAFRLDSPAEVDQQFAALTAAGHTAHVKPWDAFWGQRYATVLDPDGNSVDLFAALPTVS